VSDECQTPGENFGFDFQHERKRSFSRAMSEISLEDFAAMQQRMSVHQNGSTVNLMSYFH
jgi:hypothetical protein